RADVAEPGRTEHGIGECVGDDVAVRVACEPAVGLEANAAEHEPRPRLERVRVDSHPDAKVAHADHSDASAAGSTLSESIWSAATSVPGWSRPHGPRRIQTATRPAAAAGSTSLSTRSPTYATSCGSKPASATSRSKNPGDGLRTPQDADEPITSTGSA